MTLEPSLAMGILITVIAFGTALGLYVLLFRWMLAIDRFAVHMPRERFLGFISIFSILLWSRRFLGLLRIVVWIVALGFATAHLPPLAIAREWLVWAFGGVMAWISDILARPLLFIGEQPLSLQYIFFLIILLIMVFMVAGYSRVVFRRYLLSRIPLETGVREALATGASYIVLLLGALIALDVAGIDLSTLAVIAGALSIGIGFGLQHIVNNFVSGLVILLERPIKVGDRIEIGGLHGKVIKISARSTTIETNDNIDIIVPNSEFISDRVINWSQEQNRIRFRVSVSIAYGSDIDRAMTVMEAAAQDIPDVLEYPAPGARFISFGESGLNLELRIWTRTRLHRKGLIISDVNRAIYKAFMENNIRIPFPQRDIHIQSWPSPPADESLKTQSSETDTVSRRDPSNPQRGT